MRIRRTLALLLAVALLIQGCGQTDRRRFSDIPATAPYVDAVYWLVDRGILGGTSDTEFSPGEPMTRAMFAVALWRLAGKPQAAASANFADVKDDSWFKDAADWVSEHGYITGSGEIEEYFCGGDTVSREQAAAIVWRYDGWPASDFDYRVFFDGSKISLWARPAVVWACEKGLFDYYENDMLKPLQPITRAEFAVLLYRYETMDM